MTGPAAPGGTGVVAGATRRASLSLRTAAALLLISLIVACAERAEPERVEFERPETAVTYEVELTGVEDKKARKLIKKAIALYRQQDNGAQSLAFLRRRARGDAETVKKILRSFGYYEPEVEVFVETTPDAPVKEGETPPPDAIARVVVVQNRQYTLASHEFELVEFGDDPAPTVASAAAFGSPVGGPAIASRILDAETAAVSALRVDGRPYALRRDRVAVADPETAELSVTTTITTGRRYTYGAVVYQGLENIRTDFLDTYIEFEPGAPVNPEEMKALQRALIATGLFNAGSVDVPEAPPSGDTAPVEVALEEAPPRTVSAGVLYDTDAGPAVRGRYEHRNLYGAGETISLEALAGLEEQSLETRYRVPQYLRPGQDGVIGLSLRRVEDDAYDERGGTLVLGIERRLSPELLVGAGGLFEVTDIKDDGDKETSTLVGAPAFVDYNATDDLLDPSKGLRTRLSLTPITGLVSGEAVGYLIADATGSTYFDLSGDKRYILALRGRVASIIAGDLDVVSANRRLYSGGGGSVRGYRERFIGPLDDDEDPEGGLSAVEAGAELRVRISNTVGLAGFVEAGAVSTDTAPRFDEKVLVAAGGGVRYFSPIGPVRVDIGVPVNPRDVDDSFQFYIAIGQAF